MIATARLLLRQWRDEGIDAVAEMNADPDVMRWIGDGAPCEREASEVHFTIWRDFWREAGYGLFAVEE